jgi:hypothetical protein
VWVLWLRQLDLKREAYIRERSCRAACTKRCASAGPS